MRTLFKPLWLALALAVCVFPIAGCGDDDANEMDGGDADADTDTDTDADTDADTDTDTDADADADADADTDADSDGDADSDADADTDTDTDAGCAWEWLPMSDDGAPEARAGHAAVWAPELGLMLVYGGHTEDDGLLDEGYMHMYDPETDAWTTSATPSVDPRRPTMIWSGDSAIIWGDGGRIYHPESDLWDELPTGGDAPTVDAGNSAVWTGEAMIVWGGYAGTDYAGTDYGASYDPLLDAWSPTSQGENCPEARTYHAAIWTGTDMIVWGGYAGTDYANTGGAYDPVGDSWLPTSLIDSPSPRWFIRNSVVWTGDRMVVWGGESESDELGDGAIYDPATDSWSAMEPEGAPSPRSLHTAVWTGQEMIVWGGGSHLGLNDGGHYDPVGDTWTPTAASGAPSARYAHSAIWTGEEMIVWGGLQPFGDDGDMAPLADGKRYRCVPN